ncbi:AraC family transcriptional regulator [Coraliomargarita sp. SDUM461004]|uniref:AraC family transcriptional regulator n=1 Tax=Thalassobacterium sedimentorum TaxID=3041258 RepID=A0ABU1ALC9_9BACT|nr:AraC family transcriptional regulator [Coraliomargarita sp. SDUM461004]MDQ8195532.1 AraC family transcriptional regulator [Coraliomargarita sp. SDUM461004]
MEFRKVESAPMDAVGSVPIVGHEDLSYCKIWQFEGTTIPARSKQPHRHQVMELLWLQQGDAHFYSETGEWRVSPSSLVLVQQGQVHAWDFSEDARGYVIVFDYELIIRAGYTTDGLTELLFLNAMLYSPVAQLSASVAEEADWQCQWLMREYRSDQAYREKTMCARLKLLLVHYNRYFQGQAELKQGTAVRVTTHFVSLLDQHYHAQHSSRFYAEQLGISTYLLEKHVHASTAQSPMQWIRKRLLLEAQLRLQRPELSIAEIAYQLGFKTPSNFGRFYKKMMGHSPGDARRVGKRVTRREQLQGLCVCLGEFTRSLGILDIPLGF